MNSSKLSITILAVVSVLALTSFVMMYQGATGNAVYEQSPNKPLFLQQGAYLEIDSICAQYFCTYPGDGYYRETETAFYVGVEELAFPHSEPNIRCGCSDGRTFIIRPNLYLEETY